MADTCPRDNPEDIEQLISYRIPEIDLVVVDLYPFEQTVRNTDDEAEIIEKIDIGGISLIRAAAKNYKDVVIISCRDQYTGLLTLLKEKGGTSDLQERRHFAAEAFRVSSNYDTAIFKYFNRKEGINCFRESIHNVYPLRYGENPHQKGVFYGDPDQLFDKLHGKEISYNNILDIESGLNLINEFSEITVIIIKHNNPCGVASRDNLPDAWEAALACDPVSAYGGIIVTNTAIDATAAEAIGKIFFEIIIAPDYSSGALELLQQKKNR